MSITSAGWWITTSLVASTCLGSGRLECGEIAGSRTRHSPGLGEALQPFEDAEVQAYVTALGNRLAQQLNTPHHEYRFEVLITNDAVEPVAFHNGAVVVPAAFLARVVDETELARRIAHALGHTELQPPVQQGRPTILFSCDRSSFVVPIGLRPKQRAIEEEATACGDELARRPPTPPDTAAFARAQQTVRDTLGTPRPAGPRRAPSLPLNPTTLKTVSVISGIHPVREALRAGLVLDRVLIAKGAGRDQSVGDCRPLPHRRRGRAL